MINCLISHLQPGQEICAKSIAEIPRMEGAALPNDVYLLITDFLKSWSDNVRKDISYSNFWLYPSQVNSLCNKRYHPHSSLPLTFFIPSPSPTQIILVINTYHLTVGRYHSFRAFLTWFNSPGSWKRLSSPHPLHSPIPKEYADIQLRPFYCQTLKGVLWCLLLKTAT